MAFVRQSWPQIANVFRNDNAVLPEKTADLIDESDAISNQATANPMNRLHCQLFGGLVATRLLRISAASDAARRRS